MNMKVEGEIVRPYTIYQENLEGGPHGECLGDFDTLEEAKAKRGELQSKNLGRRLSIWHNRKKVP